MMIIYNLAKSSLVFYGTEYVWHKVIQMKTSNVSSNVWKHQKNFLIRARLVVLFVIFARVGICYFTLKLISLRASQINFIHASVNLTIIGSDYGLSPVRRQAIYWRLEEKNILEDMVCGLTAILSDLNVFRVKCEAGSPDNDILLHSHTHKKSTITRNLYQWLPRKLYI